MHFLPTKKLSFRSACANLTMCELHYVYLCEDVLQFTYAPLEASTIGREVCGFTLIRV